MTFQPDGTLQHSWKNDVIWDRIYKRLGLHFFYTIVCGRIFLPTRPDRQKSEPIRSIHHWKKIFWPNPTRPKPTGPDPTRPALKLIRKKVKLYFRARFSQSVVTYRIPYNSSPTRLDLIWCDSDHWIDPPNPKICLRHGLGIAHHYI